VAAKRGSNGSRTKVKLSWQPKAEQREQQDAGAE
jgi:hypothetical protein